MFLAPASCRRKQGRTRVAPWWLRTPHARRGRPEDEHTGTRVLFRQTAADGRGWRRRISGGTWDGEKKRSWRL